MSSDAAVDDLASIDAKKAELFWLSDDPAALIREEIAAELNTQAPGAKLNFLRSFGEPFLIALSPAAGLDGHLVAGLAFMFGLSVNDPTGRTHKLVGVISYAGVDRATPPLVRTRLFFELGASFDDPEFEATLRARMQDLAKEISEEPAPP